MTTEAEKAPALATAKARIAELEGALSALLLCPAIADGNHNEPAWGDEETSKAESRARAALEAKP